MRSALLMLAMAHLCTAAWGAGAVLDFEKVEQALGTSRAAQALDAYLKDHPEGALSARALVERARLEENVEKALENYREAARLDPEGAWGARAELELGKSEYALGRFERALLQFDSLVLDEANNALEPELLFWRAQSRFVLMGVSRARRDFEALTSKYPKHELAPAAALGAGECLMAEGDLDGAYARFLPLGAGDSPVGSQALWLAAQVQEKKGIPVKALAHYAELVRLFPNSFEATQAAKKLEGKPLPQATPTPKPTGGKSAYSIQVGAFSRQEGAHSLAEALEKKKLTVTVKKVDVRGTQYHVVRVGRFGRKEDAERFARDLNRREKLPYRVVEE